MPLKIQFIHPFHVVLHLLWSNHAAQLPGKEEKRVLGKHSHTIHPRTSAWLSALLYLLISGSGAEWQGLYSQCRSRANRGSTVLHRSQLDFLLSKEHLVMFQCVFTSRSSGLYVRVSKSLGLVKCAYLHICAHTNPCSSHWLPLGLMSDLIDASCKEGIFTAQKATTIHQVITMLTTSNNVLFPGHNHLLTAGTYDPTLWLSPKRQQVKGHLYQWLAWWLPGGFLRSDFFLMTSDVVTDTRCENNIHFSSKPLNLLVVATALSTTSVLTDH